ncbi:MAG: hypothetical protein HQM10_02510 [Candidatus Riflebacteria bacterium]|nr:hypothetical protein [Candidatus Riflebacteria bacterium]
MKKVLVLLLFVFVTLQVFAQGAGSSKAGCKRKNCPNKPAFGATLFPETQGSASGTIINMLGFAFKDNSLERATPIRVFLHKIDQVWKNPDVDKPGPPRKPEYAIGGVVTMSGMVKVLKPVDLDLNNFHADVMPDVPYKEGIVLPEGHFSFKLSVPDGKNIIADGKLIIKSEGAQGNQNDSSNSINGEYRIYMVLEDLPKGLVEVSPGGADQPPFVTFKKLSLENLEDDNKDPKSNK